MKCIHSCISTLTFQKNKGDGIEMKEMIVLIASIMLGVLLVNLIAGPQDGSSYSTVKSVWIQEIEARNITTEPAR